MQIERSESCALCTKEALVVAGGEGKKGKALATVELMNIRTKQWSMAAELPEPLWGASPALCGNSIYIVGGVNVRSSRSVYKCSVASLLQSTFSCTEKSDYGLVPPRETWQRLADLPVSGPTCVSLYEQLVLIGGEDPSVRSRIQLLLIK